MGVLVAEPDKHSTSRPWFPARDLLSVSDGLVQHIDRRSPNVTIMETTLLPSGPGEQVKGADSSVSVGKSIEEEDGMLDGHGPQRRIRHVDPMDA